MTLNLIIQLGQGICNGQANRGLESIYIYTSGAGAVKRRVKKNDFMKNVNLIGHSPLGLFRTNINKLINKYSNKHNYVKNPNWQEADQLAIYKRSREVELGATENNISQWSERDLNPRVLYPM